VWITSLLLVGVVADRLAVVAAQVDLEQARDFP
jgi:hypothetical protein